MPHAQMRLLVGRFAADAKWGDQTRAKEALQEFGTHSSRIGGATDAAIGSEKLGNLVSDTQFMKRGGWRSMLMHARYREELIEQRLVVDRCMSHCRLPSGGFFEPASDSSTDANDEV